MTALLLCVLQFILSISTFKSVPAIAAVDVGRMLLYNRFLRDDLIRVIYGAHVVILLTVNQVLVCAPHFAIGLLHKHNLITGTVVKSRICWLMQRPPS